MGLLLKPNDRGMAVTAADPSRLGLLESFAGAPRRSLWRSVETPMRGEAVVADFSTSEGRRTARDGLKAEFSGAKPADIKTKSVESLRQVSALLSAKAPGDAAAFKGWLQQISQSTAEAASEGGSLFGGGVQVSDAEKATLSEISSALGT
jgi:hypothetical protein